ncbi:MULTISPECIES: nuclear transport factor 2 family protein [Aminobacter]|jgi:hypothetical protein|uniref:SnoaL-like domain-containing protein n=1 Tax=Aminobacter aminovorans TaxID=83263 RepID=A0AAC8YQQ9_AMIAI|nr:MULTISPECIES: nuclear transport factor 2 family protein [Aminobacter]AMS42563.1 hypothetical protein AA2016_3642 [Aminobacter aminovorans]MBB3707712.1 hypothetical protein [Aminobacter aminovorans]MRX35830.1 hypothetical protein [Aminobacter sp. MDW-2]QNH32638.1 nuclear transport factor 2 family protein [Aminobacter sp. MDW-2]
MDLAERIAAEHECAKLVQRYCVLVDDYRHEELVALWAPDGLWETWKGPLRGHAEMSAYLDAKAQTDTTIHMAHNIVIDVIDEDNASGVAIFTYHGTSRNDPKATLPRVVGRYFDRFVRTTDGWKFAHRRTDMTFRAG